MYRIIILSFLVLAIGEQVRGQYHLPMDFDQTDSTTISRDLDQFSRHLGVHFGHMPGVVFRLTRAFPRIQFYYQHDLAWTASNTRYWAPKGEQFTTTGTFTGMADVTPNLQFMLRYNPMVIDGKTAVFNGFGIRYRSEVGTDSLHTLAAGVLVQKLDGAQLIRTNNLDFSIQYSRYNNRWITSFDITVSFITGQMDVTGDHDFGSHFPGEFEQRVIHLGIKAIRSWHQFNGGVTLRTNGRIWNLMFELGWSLQSNI